MSTQNALVRLAGRIFDTPHLIDPRKLAALLGGIGGRALGVQVARVVDSSGAEIEVPARMGALVNPFQSEEGQKTATPPMVQGVASVAIEGTLINKGAWIGQSSGLMSYQGITAQLLAGVNAGARGLVLDVDSGGGEASGVAGVARLIREIRQQIPVLSILTDYAASAAYYLASQADAVVIPDRPDAPGAAGSIGVVMAHVNRAKQLEKNGIEVELITSGEEKADGSELAPLPDPLRARLQGMADSIRDQFAADVEAGRGRDRLTKAQALETEARVYFGREAVDAGLADEVGSPAEAFAEFVHRYGDGSTETRPAG